MRRGELAERSGCNIETVRFYEKQGLLPAPPRTAGGHRDYDREHLKRLTFIRRSRELGFTLDRVRNLLALVDGRDWICAEVRAMTLEHLADVRRKIADLERLARILEDMAAQCDGGQVPACPVIDALLQDPQSTISGHALRP
ncbi:MAG TPA: helix-turn-helix domain-containing protein [Geminicoccaceae bacterium]|jgi:MerR family mercuric resistance operon transcriptional regulator|nr:helix-turn-helix domain-containing protein [Geminicoccaceae bacterium]